MAPSWTVLEIDSRRAGFIGGYRKPSKPRQENKFKDAEDKIFEYWQKLTKKFDSKFTKKRRDAVRKRLNAGYTPREICVAIEGLLTDEWYQEKGFNDLIYCCKSDDKLEKFRDQGQALRDGVKDE